MGAAPALPNAPSSLASTPSPSFASLITAVRDGMREGRFVRGDPAEMILFAWSTVRGLIALHFSGRFGGDDRVFRSLYAAQVRRLLRLVFVAGEQRGCVSCDAGQLGETNSG